ncbi:MAG: MerR family transcriptional regulator, partial [Acidimicrobiales bacterium]
MHPPVEESGPGDLRVDQLAARAEVSVDTIRFYQARGLLPPPRRQGRVAWYDVTHLERLDRIRRLQEQGLSLATIHR